MSKSFSADPKLVKYIENTFAPEDPVLREIRERSIAAGLREIQVGAMDGLHIEVITRAIGARKAVEIGTLGGYSGTSILRGLSPGGKLYTFEYEPLHAQVARESFKRAGFADQVEIFQGAALENLPKIEKHGPFDLVFCDADKENYPHYLEWAANHLRIGGVILGDNTLGWGMIDQDDFSNAPDYEESVRGLQKFNKSVAQSGRFRATLLPTGEGLTMGVKTR